MSFLFERFNIILHTRLDRIGDSSEDGKHPKDEVPDDGKQPEDEEKSGKRKRSLTGADGDEQPCDSDEDSGPIDVTLEDSLTSDMTPEDSDTSDGEEPSTAHWSILSFYRYLLDVLMARHGISQLNVRLAVTTKIAYVFRKVAKGELPEDIDLSCEEYCFGYLQRFAACHSALVNDFMIDLLFMSPTDEVSAKLSQRQLDVVFLGGGPGDDAVGFMYALYGVHGSLMSLKITIVDKPSDWGQIVKETFKQLKLGDFGHASLLCEDVSVIETYRACDVSLDISELDFDLIEADFVFMVRFLSFIPDEDKGDILKNVIKRMKCGALLIYIDTPFPKEEFQQLAAYLHLVFYIPLKQFRFDARETRFGWQNINVSRAEMRVYEVSFPAPFDTELEVSST